MRDHGPQLTRFVTWVWLAFGLVFTTAAQASLEDITSKFAITRSGLVLNRTTNTFDSTVTLKNITSAPIPAPIAAVVSGLPSTVTLANKTGQTFDGKGYVSPMAPGTVLPSGGTLSFVLKFANPQRVAFSYVLQVLYTLQVPPNAPSLISAVATGGTNAHLIGRVDGAPSQSITLQVSVASSCFLGNLVGGTPLNGSVATTTDAAGYFGINVSGVSPGAFVALKVTSPAPSPLSSCLISSRDNDAWPKAFLIQDATPTTSDFVDAPGKARWYKFSVTPGQRIQVAISGLPADYNLAVFKDIGQAFLSQFTPATATTASLLKLTAEYAPTVFSPTVFSPTVFSPTVFSADQYSPTVFSPTVFSPTVFSPTVFSATVFSPTVFSPTVFSPTVFSPTVFSPTVFSPTVFSQQEIAEAFSSAQTRSIIGVAVTPGAGDKSVVVNSWNNTGSFYARVTGRGDAFSTTAPFTISVSKGPTTCTGVTDTVLSARPPVAPSGLMTVILTDSSKLAVDATLPEAGSGTLRDKLSAFAARPEIQGVVVDVAADARVGALKKQAADNPACPFAKNLVAQEIKGIVDSFASNPLRYVLIVGNDETIPFFRIPDVSGLADESGYVPPVQSNSASEASLRLDFVLTQDGYGAKTNISLPSSDFPVPGLAVGRLVETAPEAAAIIDAYVATNGVVVPSTSLVTGYDFLEDAANGVRTEFLLGTGAVPDALITPNGKSPQDPASWTAAQLAATLLGKRHDVIFLAGHFSANSALAADFSTSLLTTDLVASTVNLTNAIVFSAGCHSGYNLVDSDAITGVTLPLDWAQAFAQKKATLIAGTGYQYGDTDFTEYSERLYNNFARQLRAGTGPISVGEALVKAKLDYLAITPDIRGIHQKAVLEATLFGLPMLGVNMPAGRGGSSGGGGAITPALVPSGPAHDLGLMTFDLGLSPSLVSHNVALKNVQGGSDVTASYLSGPDGVVTKPGEPVLPLLAANVTPTNPNIVLRGIGFRSGAYVDSPPISPFSGAPTTELRGVHVRFLSPVPYPGRMFNPNYFGALAGTGGTELLVTPTQHRAADLAAGTSIQRKFTGLGLRLYYSGNLSKAALSEAPVIVSVDAQPDAGGVLFTAQVVGDPAAAIPQVWVTYTSDGAGAWTSLDLSQCVAPLPAACGASEDSRLWKGRLASTPTNLKYMVQAVNGVGLVALDDNRGGYYGIDATIPAATSNALVSPPTTATVGDSVNFTTKLTIAGVPLAGKTVTISVGGVSVLATTGSDGSVTVKLPVTTLPGTYVVTTSFAGDDVYEASSTTTTFVVNKAVPTLTMPPAGGGFVGAVLKGVLGGKSEVLQQESVSFSVTGPGGSKTIWAITDYLGQAKLPPPGPPGLQAGNYTATQASFAGNSIYSPISITFTPALQFTVPKTAQSISFDLLPDVSYGEPAFDIFPSASSGLPVSLSASGICSVAGNSVQVGGVGSCTITASQAGNSDYLAAALVARTFSISPASQSITFGPAPAGVTVGQPLVFVIATSTSPTAAASTMPITFTSLTPSICTMGGADANASIVTLVAAGQCTIAADQSGDANYNATPQATQTFTVAAAGTLPATFTVTNLNNSGPGSLRAAIASANAATPGSNVVTFAPGVTGTIVLTTGQIQISRSVRIDGPGADNLTIDGNASSRIFSIFATDPACPALDGPDYLVEIDGLRLTNAWRLPAGSSGGAIFTEHSLILDSVVIDHSIARSGGGVFFSLQYPGQALFVGNSQFLNNTATELATPPFNPVAGSEGGAIAIIERCQNPNPFDVPHTAPVSVAIVNSEFRGNRSQPVTLNGRGGAIRSWSLADIAISDSIFVDNHVVAPNPPNLTLGYHGGAFDGSAKSLRIERSEIAENSVSDATGADITRSGGLHLYKNAVDRQAPGDAMAVRIVNSTISGNTSAATAGAMVAFGNVALELDNTTVNGNSAAPTRTGGIVMSSGDTYPISADETTAPTLKLVSSILANNSSNGGDVATNTATMPTFGINAFNSLIQKPCPTCSIVVSGPGTFVGADPLVGPLAFNGGLTRTHALLPGSPAINTGSNPLGLATDQRGFGFPRLLGTPIAIADMGAYEVGQSLAIAAGTYFSRTFGLLGTGFMFDPITTSGTLPSVTVTGPPSWNGGSPFNCVRYQPPGTDADRSICWLFALPITGSYAAQGTAGSISYTGSFSIDAANQLATTQITSVQVAAGTVTVGWTAAAAAGSFLVRVNPVPFTGITGEKIVSGDSRTATLTGLTLTMGANYQVNVFAFSQDVRTPDPLASVFNISADNMGFVGP